VGGPPPASSTADTHVAADSNPGADDPSLLERFIAWLTGDDSEPGGETETESKPETEVAEGPPEQDALPVARTIMAYGSGCGNCIRIPYWSTPESEVTYEGHSIGTADLEDNARVLNFTAPAVAGFRSQLGQP
jgi:hypothetical protein